MSCFFLMTIIKPKQTKMMVHYLTYLFLWVTLSGVAGTFWAKDPNHWWICWFVKDMIFLRTMPLTYFLNVRVGQLDFTSSNSNLARWANYLRMKCSFLSDVSLCVREHAGTFPSGLCATYDGFVALVLFLIAFAAVFFFQFSHCTAHPTVST